MSLRYLVPAMGLLACSVPLSAETVGKLTIDGYVDTVFSLSSYDPGTKGSDTNSNAGFVAGADIDVAYTLSDKVSARIELNETSHKTGHTATDLQEAYVSWNFTDPKSNGVQAGMKAGRFHSWIGFEGNDAPELWRVNTSIVSKGAAGGKADVTGLGVSVEPMKTEDMSFCAGLYIVNGIYNAGIKDETDADLGYALRGSFMMKDMFKADLSLNYEPGIATDDKGEGSDAFGVDLYASIDALKKSLDLEFGLEVNYLDLDTYAAMGILLAGKYNISKEALGFASSVSLMIGYVDPNDDSDIDDEMMEIAVAYCTTPVEKVGANVEVRYMDTAKGDDNATDIGLFLELLAVMP